MSEFKYLAMYDFRGKQSYIYKTNKVKEIVGASAYMANAFEKFKKEILDSRFSGLYQEVYEGGGNLLIMYKDKDTMLEANRMFDRMLLDDTVTLKALFSYTEITGNFQEDRKKLYIDNNLKKSTGLPQYINTVLPFTMVERLNSAPVVKKEKGESLSLESVKKREYYESLSKDVYQEFDKMVDKGDDSLLAVMYIDGNEIGKRVKGLLEGITGYEQSVKKLKEFSAEINDIFVVRPLKVFDRAKYIYRKIISAGDEITIVCKGKQAFKMLKDYFAALAEGNAARGTNYSACCGICIFHSHEPFVLAYETAHQCCENAKKKSRINGGGNFFDYHLSHSGIGFDLKDVRQQDIGRFLRPFETNDILNKDSRFNLVAEDIKKIGRGNLKNLMELMSGSNTDFQMELLRLKAKYSIDLRREDMGLIFDIGTVYDLWFAKDEEA